MINLSVLDESTLVTPIVAEIFVTDSAQKKMKEILDDFDSEKRGIDVVVDRKTMNLTQGTKIDYTDGLMQSGFKIENPKAQATCGCGQSFA